MVALNCGDLHTYNFEGEVLPLALSQNAGVAAMKVYGGAEAMKYETAEWEAARPSAMKVQGHLDHELALRYALGLPGVSTAVVGMYTEAELLENIEWVRRFEPLSVAELNDLQVKGLKLAAAWGTHYGIVH